MASWQAAVLLNTNRMSYSGEDFYEVFTDEAESISERFQNKNELTQEEDIYGREQYSEEVPPNFRNEGVDQQEAEQVQQATNNSEDAYGVRWAGNWHNRGSSASLFSSASDFSILDKQKQFATTFTQIGFNPQQSFVRVGISTDPKNPSKYTNKYRQVISAIMDKAIRKLYSIVKEIKGEVREHQQKEVLLALAKNSKNWLVEGDVKSLNKLIRNVYRIQSPPVGKGEMLLLYEAITRRLDDYVKNNELKSTIKYKNTEVKNQEGVPKVELEDKRSIGDKNRSFLSHRIGQMFVTYKKVSTVESELKRRFPQFDWSHQVINRVIGDFVESGVRRVNKLREKHAKLLQDVQLHMIRDEEIKALRKEETDPRVKSLLIQMVLMKKYYQIEDIRRTLNSLQSYLYGQESQSDIGQD